MLHGTEYTACVRACVGCYFLCMFHFFFLLKKTTTTILFFWCFVFSLSLSFIRLLSSAHFLACLLACFVFFCRFLEFYIRYFVCVCFCFYSSCFPSHFNSSFFCWCVILYCSQVDGFPFV